MVKNIRLFLFLFFIIFYKSYSLSLEEAVKLVKNNYPYIKAEKEKVISTKFDYKSEIFNFFPTISFQFDYTKYKNIYPKDYNTKNYSITLNWVVYNSGQNIVRYKLGKNRYKYQYEIYKENLLDTIYKVKKAYIYAVAKKKIVKFREIQLKSAKVDYDVAVSKYKLGLVKKSDVLTAKVRYENLKYLYIQSKSDYEVALAELNSILGFPLNKSLDLEENILYRYTNERINNFETLFNEMKKNRPILKSFRYERNIAILEKEKNLYSFTPKVSLFIAKKRSYNSLGGSDTYSMYGVRLDWLIFDGLGRYYRYISSKHKELETKYRIADKVRELKLRLFKKVIEYNNKLEKIKVAKSSLKEAELNYKQTLGEYKVGKNDIVALINSESNLADAQIKFINSLLETALTKVEIEREIGKLN